ncbi:MAG: ATP-binding protein [Acidobacteriia bacterium]|nr:ATP-binding protein [Terriglobia bacterium]
MPVMCIMCGLAFAGKTTVARALAVRLGARTVSLDEINAERGLFGGQGLPVEEWERSHRVALARADRLLQRRVSTVIDDTSCFRWLRDRYREVGSRRGCDVVVVLVATPLDEALRRLDANAATGERHGVRPEILEALARTFEAPGPDEPTVAFAPGEPLETWLERHFPAAT